VIPYPRSAVEKVHILATFSGLYKSIIAQPSRKYNWLYYTLTAVTGLYTQLILLLSPKAVQNQLFVTSDNHAVV
jgi:hypothetical protein